VRWRVGWAIRPRRAERGPERLSGPRSGSGWCDGWGLSTLGLLRPFILVRADSFADVPDFDGRLGSSAGIRPRAAPHARRKAGAETSGRGNHLRNSASP